MDIYETIIEDFGGSAQDFLSEGMFVIFEHNAPEELKNFCFLHSLNQLNHNIEINDIVEIGEIKGIVKYVGEAVNKNLKELGHITFSIRDEYKKSPMAGTLYLSIEGELNINIGSKIKISRR